MTLLDSIGAAQNQSTGMYGVAPAIVTNNQDPEGLGRVKVRFPWLSDDNETDWIRVATLMAGPDRGSFFLPEVGDEVLVGFQHGDINAAYVIGALWNGQHKPPETNSDGKNSIRKFRSRSGHEIVFNDDKDSGQEKIEIHTKSGHRIVLDDSTGAEKIELIDRTGSNKIVIDSGKNSITIESMNQISLKATNIEIEASGNLTLKANAVLTIKGLPVKIN